MKALAFDCETTGLIRNRTLKLVDQPEVIEFTGLLVDLKKGGKILSELDILIKPLKPLSDKPALGDKKTITQITGISNEMLESKGTFSINAKKIFVLIEKAPLVIAHNASFDKEMLDIEAERLGKEIKWPRVICTVEATIAMKGFRLTLSNLYELLFNEKFEGAHRARVDVEALVRICVELFKRGML